MSFSEIGRCMGWMMSSILQACINPKFLCLNTWERAHHNMWVSQYWLRICFFQISKESSTKVLIYLDKFRFIHEFYSEFHGCTVVHQSSGTKWIHNSLVTFPNKKIKKTPKRVVFGKLKVWKSILWLFIWNIE